MANPSLVRTEIEAACNVFLGWTRPASEKTLRMHFIPQLVSDFLFRVVPGLSIGATNQYIWTMAFAESRDVFALALRNLSGLLPDDFGGTVDWTKEEAIEVSE